GSRDEASGRAAAQTAQAEGGPATFLPLDVCSSESIAAAARAYSRVAGHLDVLINNAGIYPDKGVTVLTVSREQLTETFQTNTFGPLAVTQAFLPFLRKAPAARVINVSSGYGQLDGLSPDVPSYCLSKLALNGLTLMLSRALQAEGIAVNSMFIGKDALKKFQEAKIEDPAVHFKGKTIVVTGKVTLYREKPQIAVEGPDQIQVEEKKP